MWYKVLWYSEKQRIRSIVGEKEIKIDPNTTNVMAKYKKPWVKADISAKNGTLKFFI